MRKSKDASLNKFINEMETKNNSNLIDDKGNNYFHHIVLYIINNKDISNVEKDFGLII